MVLRSKMTSLGLFTLEEGGGGYVVKLNGSIIRGVYSNVSDAIREFDSIS